ncbi:hypothetical protein [Phenylobacterium sp. J367]|uniref:hypothetical protein n=1 Tax=Phenylobacterium sp. J367 TaxID=2898435 RepID=UPI002151AF1A|nr:hypothetical protein [Phenylobacterium sp. J367]MCR5877502.1 hypothetical protein [Phenylobacterium sp. J367]
MTTCTGMGAPRGQPGDLAAEFAAERQMVDAGPAGEVAEDGEALGALPGRRGARTPRSQT